MKSPGYIQLQQAAAEFHQEPCCPKCKNPEFEPIGSRTVPEFLCPECKEQFFPDQALLVNFFDDAMRIWAEKGYDSARFDHIDVVLTHAETLHLRVLELEELLKLERRRLAGSQQVVNECSALSRELANAR